MDNRFGLKDFLLFALVTIVLAAVVLGMIQYDRQWKIIQRLEQQNETLASDINQLGSRMTSTSDDAGGPQIVQNFYGVSNRPNGGRNATEFTLPGGQNDPTGGANATAGGQSSATPEPQQVPVVELDDSTFSALRDAETEPDFARGGWFLDNFGTKIGRLTPLVSSDVYQTWIEFLVLESLAQRNPDTLEFEPKLAESWDISEDGLEMTFYLRDGIRFSDGEPLTAEDVVFTFDWIANPEVQADRARSYLTKLESVEAIDERTVRFTFNDVYFLNFSTIAGVGIMPEHIISDIPPTEYNESLGLLIGSGPFMLQDPYNWTPSQDVVLVRNPRYWGVPTTFDRMIFKQIQEEAAEEVMFRNGELDRYAALPDQFDKLKADEEIQEIADAMNYDTPFGGYTYIGWNQIQRDGDEETETIFADPRVRRALTMMIDRQRLVDDLYMGYANVADGPFAPTSPQSNPEIEPWPYDVDAALDLLAEAGWEDRDGDGVLENEEGTMLRFNFLYPGGSAFTERIVLSIQDNLAEGGVLAELERADWPVLVDRLKKSNFEAVTLGWSSVPETDPYQIFHSDQAKVGGDNRTGYRSAELDAAIEAARVEMDTDERMKKWHEVHRILHEDQPYTFLLNRQALRFFNKRVKNVEKATVGLNYEYLNGGVLPWYIPSDQQRQTR
jgi:peptide/nickel transport system substrate-binding protein